MVARFNRPGMQAVDHYTHVLAGDGDLWWASPKLLCWQAILNLAS